MIENNISRRKVLELAAAGLFATSIAAINDSVTVKAVKDVANWTADSSTGTGLLLPEQDFGPGLANKLISPNGVGPYEGKYTVIVPGLVVPEYTKETPLIARKPDWSEDFLREPKALTTIPVTKPLVALTIDDGFIDKENKRPMIRYEMLSMLSYLGVTATFCMLGDRVLDADRKFIMAASASGLIEWGNHTWRHHDLRNNSEPELIEDIMRLERLLNEYGQTTLPYLRPPGGGFSPWTMRIGADLSFKHVMWEAEGDTGNLSNQALLDHYVSQITAGGIILMHFSPSTVDFLLPALVKALRAKGLEPTALSNVIANSDLKS